MTAKKLDHSVVHDDKQAGAESLIGEFKSLMADAEALIKATEDHPGEAISSIRNKALETLAADSTVVHQKSNAVAHLWIESPLDSKMTSKLFATHPAIEERIANLRALEQTGPLNESA